MEDRVIRLINKWHDSQELTLDELKFLAFFDLRWLHVDVAEQVEDIVWSFLFHNGKAWDSFDEQYPRNPYYTGFVYEGWTFALGYTGCAGRHWKDDDGATCFDVMHYKIEEGENA